jgi:hypothetical protein
MTTTNYVALLLAAIGSLFLFYWWATHHRSGLRGFLLMVAGSAFILIITDKWGHLAQLFKELETSLLPLVIAFTVAFLLAMGLIYLEHKRGTRLWLYKVLPPMEPLQPLHRRQVQYEEPMQSRKLRRRIPQPH